MMPPQAAHVFRVSVMMTEKFERATAIIQAEMNREIISALCLSCYRYIECNPLRAKMVVHPADYRWSSYRHHAEGKTDALILDHALYRGLGKTKTDRCRAYRTLCEQVLDAGTLQSLREATNTGWVLGNEPFKTKVEGALKRRASRLQRGGKRPGAGRPKQAID
jgi:putative transposase